MDPMDNTFNYNYQQPSSSGAGIPPPPLPGTSIPVTGGASYSDLLEQQLQMFWAYQRQDIEQVTDFKTHPLPLARIKKIMKADEDVRMIAAEAPILFAKACELFILELTIRSWFHAEQNKRRTLQKDDLAAVLSKTEIYDFLVDLIPRDENNENKDETVQGGMETPTSSGVPFYYPPMGQPTGTGEMMHGIPAMDPSGLYMQPPSQAWPSAWQPTGDDVSYGSGGSSSQGNLDGQVQSFPDDASLPT